MEPENRASRVLVRLRERLANLCVLRDTGVLTLEEYERQRHQQIRRAVDGPPLVQPAPSARLRDPRPRKRPRLASSVVVPDTQESEDDDDDVVIDESGSLSEDEDTSHSTPEERRQRTPRHPALVFSFAPAKKTR